MHTGSRRVKHFIEQLGCGFVLHDPGQLLLTSAEKMVPVEKDKRGTEVLAQSLS